jgi:hypothetical protein
LRRASIKINVHVARAANSCFDPFHMLKWIIALLLVVTARGSGVAKIPSIRWQNSMVDESCPRFTFVPEANEGLGHQMFRAFPVLPSFLYALLRIRFPIFFALAEFLWGVFVSTKMNTTLVSSDLGRVTFHTEHDSYDKYEWVIKNVFGIDYMTLQEARNKFKTEDHEARWEDLQRLNTPSDFLEKFPGCNKVFVTTVDSCPGWCSHHVPDGMKTIQWQLRHWAMNSVCHNAWEQSVGPARGTIASRAVLHNEALNVAWHVRTGDITLHTLDKTGRPYYENVANFVSDALVGCRVNMVVLTQDRANASAFLEKIIPEAQYPKLNISDTYCAIMSSDLFISMGSSYGDLAAMFSQPYRPVVMQETEKYAPDGANWIFSIEGVQLNRQGEVTNGIRPQQVKAMILSAMLSSGDTDRMQRACT